MVFELNQYAAFFTFVLHWISLDMSVFMCVGQGSLGWTLLCFDWALRGLVSNLEHSKSESWGFKGWLDLPWWMGQFNNNGSNWLLKLGHIFPCSILHKSPILLRWHTEDKDNSCLVAYNCIPHAAWSRLELTILSVLASIRFSDVGFLLLVVDGVCVCLPGNWTHGFVHVR